MFIIVLTQSRFDL